MTGRGGAGRGGAGRDSFRHIAVVTYLSCVIISTIRAVVTFSSNLQSRVDMTTAHAVETSVTTINSLSKGYSMLTFVLKVKASVTKLLINMGAAYK